MFSSPSGPIRGTELCKRALYHSIVGTLPTDCPDGCTVVTDKSDGKQWLMDHVRGKAFPYQPACCHPATPGLGVSGDCKAHSVSAIATTTKPAVAADTTADTFLFQFNTERDMFSHPVVQERIKNEIAIAAQRSGGSGVLLQDMRAVVEVKAKREMEQARKQYDDNMKQLKDANKKLSDDLLLSQRQLSQRKGEVQTLQNKLRIIHKRVQSISTNTTNNNPDASSNRMSNFSARPEHELPWSSSSSHCSSASTSDKYKLRRARSKSCSHSCTSSRSNSQDARKKQRTTDNSNISGGGGVEGVLDNLVSHNNNNNNNNSNPPVLAAEPVSLVVAPSYPPLPPLAPPTPAQVPKSVFASPSLPPPPREESAVDPTMPYYEDLVPEPSSAVEEKKKQPCAPAVHSDSGFAPNNTKNANSSNINTANNSNSSNSNTTTQNNNNNIKNSSAAPPTAPIASPSSKSPSALLVTFPGQLLQQHSNALLFCHICRIFLPPHATNLHQHMFSSVHTRQCTQLRNATATAGQPAGASSRTLMDLMSRAPPEIFNLSYRAQFDKDTRDLPLFIVPQSVIRSVKEQSAFRAEGNRFFDDGFDIVTSICAACRVRVSIQNYKSHESSPEHRRLMKVEGISKAKQ